ncbi:MAG: metallophosphoesterase [Planctomycetota bacterium]
MATWIIGDIHGCSEELAELLRRIAPTAHDQIVSCGDLFHRGPDPAGVLDLLRESRASFILGNHERAILKRIGIAPQRWDGADRGPLDIELPELDAEDLAGDGRTPCAVPAERREEVVRFLQREHSGYLLRRSAIRGAGLTNDGREWLVVHAGFDPGRRPEDCSADMLCGIRRLEGRGRPWWYERWEGPELVLFGHTHSAAPRLHSRGGQLVALGLDTGCVYGGALSAYSPELDDLIQVPALRPSYAARP